MGECEIIFVTLYYLESIQTYIITETSGVNACRGGACSIRHEILMGLLLYVMANDRFHVIFKQQQVLTGVDLLAFLVIVFRSLLAA